MLRIKMWFPPHLSGEDLTTLVEEMTQAVRAMPELSLRYEQEAIPILVRGKCGVYVEAYCTLHCPRPQRALIREQLATGLGRAIQKNVSRAAPIWVHVYSSVPEQGVRWNSKPATW